MPTEPPTLAIAAAEVDAAPEDASSPVDVPTLVRGRAVALTGRLASMTREQFQDVVRSFGGRVSSPLSMGPGVSLLVVGQAELPLNAHGELPWALRVARVLKHRHAAGLTVLPESRFLAGLGLDAYRDTVSRTHTASTLCSVLGVSHDRLRAWVYGGLIAPVATIGGVWHFDFAQVSSAKTLSDLTASGVTPGRLRRSLSHFERMVPDVREPLQQLARLQKEGGRLLVRLEAGELAEPDGQLQLFGWEHEEAVDEGDDGPASLRIGPAVAAGPGPRDAAGWKRQAAEQELAGYPEEAIDSYRQALLAGGPDRDTCYDLGCVLIAAGKRQEACERFRQAVEIDSSFAEAWNNLGLALESLGQAEEAVEAFRRALAAAPDDARAHYNLADTLDELGRRAEAAPHWRAYLRAENTSRWAAHARRRLEM